MIFKSFRKSSQNIVQSITTFQFSKHSDFQKQLPAFSRPDSPESQQPAHDPTWEQNDESFFTQFGFREPPLHALVGP